MTETELLKARYDILLKGLQKIANQPRLMSYGTFSDKNQGIEEERRRTVLLAREILKEADALK